MSKLDSKISAAAADMPTEKAAQLGSNPAGLASTSSSWMKWAVVLLPLGFLWFTLINQLRVEWSVNPQYSYGWVVPFLCLGLLLRRWQAWPEVIRGQWSVVTGQSSVINSQRSVGLIFALLAFIYLPARLIQEANPEWRLISWVLALEVVGLTLLLLRSTLGSAGIRWFAFPICFFLVAVPWPTPIEAPLIQSLTRINSAITVEVLGWTGIPAIQHGNLIEVGTGTVGVSEACSGIRSFQTSLMISLFFGEFYFMGLWRRLLLVPAGFVLAMAFNVCRMTFLTMVAAKKGVAAIDHYHDQAGIAITITCTLVLWGVSALINKKRKTETLKAVVEKQKEEISDQRSEVGCQISAFQNFRFQRWGFVLFIWLIAVEVGVESWYRWHEARLPQSVLWSMDWPRSNPTFSQLPIGEKATQMLRYDEAVSAMWREEAGTQWQMTYLRWLPGRIAVYLANQHTPDACLPAAGHSVQVNPGLDYMSVHGLRLPFRTYSFEERGETSYVFYCLWEDRAQDQSFRRTSLTYGNRLEPVLEGRRNAGERSLEVVVQGFSNMAEAQNGLVRQLEKLLKVEKPEQKS